MRQEVLKLCTVTKAQIQGSKDLLIHEVSDLVYGLSMFKLRKFNFYCIIAVLPETAFMMSHQFIQN